MFTINQIEEAHNKVKSGKDFPKYIQEIKAMGVNEFETFVIDGHTNFHGENAYQTASAAVYKNLVISPSSDSSQFKHYLTIHQKGKTDFLTFCKHCAETGIEKWSASLSDMTCTYFDIAGTKILVEKIPRL